MDIKKLIDTDSGETEFFRECEVCDGAGGYDASTDCESYSDWHICDVCEGSGELAFNVDDSRLK